MKQGLEAEKDAVVIPFSAQTKQGREEIYDLIDNLLAGRERRRINPKQTGKAGVRDMQQSGSTKYIKAVLNLLTAVVLLLLVIFVLPRLLGFFMPFVVAGSLP